MSAGFATRTGSHIPQRVLDRFWVRVDIRGPDECWSWKRSSGSHGYGQIGWQTDQVRGADTSHRVAWVSANGLIPQGMTVDHECHNRICCNPAHLRLKTNIDNATDQGQRDKTHCPRGHEYAGSNLYVTPRGHRRCRECARIVKKEWLNWT